jgi:hypothetical protein
MRALVTSESGLQIEDVPELDAGPGPVLVGNRHLAINFGDLNGSRNRPAGFIPRMGWLRHRRADEGRRTSRRDPRRGDDGLAGRLGGAPSGLPRRLAVVPRGVSAFVNQRQPELKGR